MQPAQSLRYRRVLLKLSGEALMGMREYGICPETLAGLADEIAETHGWASSWRWSSAAGTSSAAPRDERGPGSGHRRPHGHAGDVDQRAGLAGRARARGLTTRVLSALEIRQVAEPFIRRRALRHLEKGRV